jgi:prepilin-type N-terminal cleavage/methylation domain-containing protein
MSTTKVRHRQPWHSAGFTLIEALVALTLLAVCLLPAANALRNAGAAPAVAAGAARKLDCVSSLMETVLAQPYNRLLSFATATGTSSYPIPDDAACPQRSVTIARYGKTSTRSFGFGTTDDYLLYVSVALADPADGNPFTLTTLVAR